MPRRVLASMYLVLAWIALAAPAVARAQDSGLTITLDKFGVGNLARRGDTAGIRLVLVDSSASNRSVLIRISRLDPDGDTIESERVVTTNPGVQQGVWFYLRVPYDFQSTRDSGMVATAYEAIENESPAPGAPQFSSGRRLARLSFDPKLSSVLDKMVGLIGITGTANLGLQAYSQGEVGQGTRWVAGRGEETELVTGIQPQDMPDEWHGWAPFETLVWTKGEPNELKGERARAIREWVQRGGHLVIVLPAVGQTWTNRQSNELFSILPTVSIKRREGVDLEAYRAMLVGKKGDPVADDNGRVLVDEKGQPVVRGLSLPSRSVVHTFAPMPEAGPGEAIRILNGPDGECVVARRLVGLGCVDLVGLDLPQGKTDAVAFWHRVLGKRGKIITAGDLKTSGNAVAGSPVILDQGISGELNEHQQGKSATGLFLGFVIFIVYWLVAGPVGFALLKKRRQTAHAWVMFFLSAVVFTAIAWAGATSLRPKKIEVSHITLFDHVYGQTIQRARTWASVLLPDYGDATIRVGEPEAASSSTTTWDFISPWETSDDDAGRASFLDARAYREDARTPDSMRVPTRATVKEIIADWAGGTVWRMPSPDVDKDGKVSKIEWKDQGPGKPPMLTGVLVHELPGTLKEVTVLIVQRQADYPRSGNPPQDLWFTRGLALGLIPEWPAGEALDVGLLQEGKTLARTNILGFLDKLVPAAPQANLGWPGASSQPQRPVSRLLSAMFTPLLPGPEINPQFNASPVVALRSATHCWDLARWFTHPCLIIVGELEGPAPTPIFVDGKPVSSTGKTYVRWVYPLPDDPPAFQGVEDKSDAAAPAPPGPNPTADEQSPPL